MRIMALDIGTKNIGVAVSDETRMIAQSRGAIKRTGYRDVIKKIQDFIVKFDAAEIVVGLPLNMDGTAGERAADSENFAERLEKGTGVIVTLWDERLSTKEAEDVMIEAGVSRRKRKKVLDGLAAQIILQGYLDNKCSGKREED